MKGRLRSLVHLDGETILVEAKAWSPTPNNIRRAIHQLGYYKKLPGVDNAFIVLQDLKKKSDFNRGIVSLRDLAAAISRSLIKPSRKKRDAKKQSRGRKKFKYGGGKRKSNLSIHATGSEIILEERRIPKSPQQSEAEL